jgi:chromate reductase
MRNKPAAVISSSTGMFGGVWAAAETRKVLGALAARVLDEAVTVPKAHERLASRSDDALDQELRNVLSALGHEVELRAVSGLEPVAA